MLSIGQVLDGRYRIVSDGATLDIGTEYKAYDTQHEQLVVVLLLSHRFGSGAGLLDQLLRAAQKVSDLALAALIPFEHVGLADGQPYLVRAQVEGQSLAELLARAGPLRLDVALRIAIQICEVLAPAHRSGLVHGGLSPHSIRLTEEGQVIITDAGLLPALRPESAPPGQPWGRFPYLSPEQAAGEEVHPASDVYVIGSLLYEMLTGRPPFRGPNETALAMQHLRQAPPSLQVLRSDTPLPLVQIIHKALAKEPAVRYRNAGQLAHILRSQLAPWLAEATPPPRVSVRPAPAARPPAIPQTAERYDVRAEAEYWAEEPEGIDWFMILLIVVALTAVLGLIPLWRTVYRRYSAPQPSPAAALNLLPKGSAGAFGSTARGGTEVEDLADIWYNQPASRLPWMAADPTWRGSPEPKRSPAAFLTAVLASGSEKILPGCWERSLRVLAINCSTLVWQ